DEPHAAQALDTPCERPDCERISVHCHGDCRPQRLLAEVTERGSGVQYTCGHGGICADPLCNQIRCALRMAHFVGCDDGEQCSELRLLGLRGEAAEEMSGEMLRQHELDEALDQLVRLDAHEGGGLTQRDQLLIGDCGLPGNGVEVT